MSENIFRELTSGFEGKKKLLEGLRKSCDIVSSTMSYRGSNNLFEQLSGLPLITKDGHDSLEQLFWADPLEAMSLAVLKEAVKKSFEVVGDNTTLTTVLTLAFFENSIKAMENGESSIEIKEKIEASVLKVIEYIDSIAIPVTEKLMYDVAKTSAHGDDEIAQIVTEAFIKAGEFGIVSHKRSFTDETYIEHISGNPIENGYTHECFVNVQESQSVVFDDPFVLCSMNNFQTEKELIPFLNYASDRKRPLVIISNMEHDIATLVMSNVMTHKFPFCIIKPPFLGKKGRETMDDIALVLGCKVLSGVPTVDFQGKEELHLGTCERIEIKKKDTVITPSKSVDKSKIDGKITELSEQIKFLDNEGEKNYIRERISKLSGGISTILVGGITPSEVDEKVARFDDAVCAVRASKDGGVVAGGGIALMNANRILTKEIDDVTSNSILSPLKKIMSNAGVENVSFHGSYPMGYDVKEYKEVNMFDAGIIDTAKGVKTALINAVSASNNLLRTDNCITFKRMENGK